MANLTEAQRAILAKLDRLGPHGGLTGSMAVHLFGAKATSARVRRPCVAMARVGLVARHPTNNERWFITDAGRSALSSPDTTGANRE